MLPITRRLLATAPRRLQAVSLRPNLVLTSVARASATTTSITRTAFSTFSKASFAATLSKDKAFTADKYPHLQRNQEFKKVCIQLDSQYHSRFSFHSFVWSENSD
jgi:hypothetical protein